MRKLIINVFLLIPGFCFSQSLGLVLEGGISKNYMSSEKYEEMYGGEYLEMWQPSYNVGFFYHQNFNDRHGLGCEIKFSQIQSKEKWTLQVLDPSYGEYEAEWTFTQRISYLAIPVYYSYSIQRLSFVAGARIGLKFSDQTQTVFPEEHVSNNEVGTAHSSWGTDRIDYGVQGGIEYSLAPSLAVNMMYYHGLANLEDWGADELGYKIQNRQLTMGIKYTLIKPDHEK